MFCKIKKPVSIMILLLVVSLTTGCFLDFLWAKTYSLKVTFNEEYGTVEGIPAKSDKIKEGTILELKAVAKQGYVFDKWTGVPEGNEKDNPVEIIINSNTTITAEFASEVIKPEEDFEELELGRKFGTMGWGLEDGEAVVDIDPKDEANKVLKFAPSGYGNVPVIELTLPEGKTLADYSTFSFKGFFAEGDVSYKEIGVGVFSSQPSGPFDLDGDYIIGKENRSKTYSDSWEDIVIEITGSDSISGHIYVAFGMNQDKSGDDEKDTVWYADDVKFVEKTE